MRAFTGCVTWRCIYVEACVSVFVFACLLHNLCYYSRICLECIGFVSREREKELLSLSRWKNKKKNSNWISNPLRSSCFCSASPSRKLANNPKYFGNLKLEFEEHLRSSQQNCFSVNCIHPFAIHSDRSVGKNVKSAFAIVSQPRLVNFLKIEWLQFKVSERRKRKPSAVKSEQRKIIRTQYRSECMKKSCTVQLINETNCGFSTTMSKVIALYLCRRFIFRYPSISSSLLSFYVSLRFRFCFKWQTLWPSERLQWSTVEQSYSFMKITI